MKITIQKSAAKLLSVCAIAAILQGASTLLATAHEGHGAHATASKPKTFRAVRGQIVAVIKPKKAGEKTAVTLDHENIPNFMRAMRMTLPLQNSADAKKLKKGAKISFDMVLKDGNFLVANIKILPAKTKLKLAPM